MIWNPGLNHDASTGHDEWDGETHQQDGVEDIVVQRRLIDVPAAADALACAVHHVGDGQLGYGHGRCRLCQLGQSRADVVHVCRNTSSCQTEDGPEKTLKTIISGSEKLGQAGLM